MIDTAGSICNAAKAIVEVGGASGVYACASHGVLSGPALGELSGSVIKEVALLNTLPEEMGAGCDKIKYLSVAPHVRRGHRAHLPGDLHCQALQLMPGAEEINCSIQSFCAILVGREYRPTKTHRSVSVCFSSRAALLGW